MECERKAAYREFNMFYFRKKERKKENIDNDWISARHPQQKWMNIVGKKSNDFFFGNSHR